MRSKKAKAAGIGTVLMAGAVFFAWKKGEKHRIEFVDWKKRKIEDMYYKNMDEQDIAWG
jgi:hypothetical protein|tara:strand:+ start:8689 stop:8865 length:177 start_codon:yes stop_codon:yes gene_type:complete